MASQVHPAELAKRIARRQLSQLEMLRDLAMAKGENAADAAEIYALIAANFAALLYWAGGRSKRDGDEPAIHPDITALSKEFDDQFPHLRRYRNFMAHPKFPEFRDDEATWLLFSDGPWIAKKNGTAVPIIDVEMDHHKVRGMYGDFVALLDEVLAEAKDGEGSGDGA